LPNNTQRLALGTVQFGLPYGISNQTGQVSRSEAKQMLQLSQANGIDTLDTAIGYGESETLLGEIGIEGFRIITNLPAVPDACTDITQWVQKQINASRLRLGINVIYGLLLHSPEQLIGPKGKLLKKILQDLKNRGQVKKVGISIYDPDQLNVITEIFSPDIVQTPFNLLDRRIHTTGWLQRLKDNGVEIHTRSIFLQGLLLMSRSAIPPQFAPWSNLWDTWHNWLVDKNISAVAACLAFVLTFPAIDRIVVGADSTNQLNEIINAAGQMFTDFPDLESKSESLINPSKWNSL
jgi:aryl-alcohol dehydrogenase-like predicted oxidoreductase